VLQAANAYGLDVAELALVAESFNTVFRIVDSANRTFALRVGPELRIHPDGLENVEAAWLTELADANVIPVGRVCRNAAGDVLTSVDAPGVSGTRDCVLFDWVPGQALRHRATAARVIDAGRMLAVLHEHTARSGSAKPPPGAMVADQVLYFCDDRLIDQYSSRFGSLLVESLARAQRTIDGLWANPPHPPHLLHGDYTWDNLMVERSEITVIDFQDLVWGFEVQDIVMALYAFDAADNADELCDQFRSGYESARAWPADEPHLWDALVAARRLMQINLSLNLRKPGWSDHIDRLANQLRVWMA